MKLPICCSTGFSLLLLGCMGSVTLTVSAQDKAVLATPKIMVITREFTKPGKDGAAHEKTEGAYIHALAQFKAADRYIAVTSLSGESRVLFMGSYDSFAALETVRRTDAKNAALSTAVDRATAADSELLRLVETSTWIRRDDLSLNPGFRVGARYEEISQLSIRPGHLAEWEELVKLVQDGYKKGIPEAHWGAYEEAYGTPGGRYLIIITLRSAAEIDANFASGKKFEEAMGEEGMKKMAKLEASCVESEQTNLFMIQPKMSYPPEATIQAEPGFWKVTPTAP